VFVGGTGVSVGKGVWVGGMGVFVRDGVWVGSGVFVGADVRVGAGVKVAVGAAVSVGPGVLVGVLVLVPVAVAAGVWVAMAVGVWVGVTAGGKAGVFAGKGVSVDTGVDVGDSVVHPIRLDATTTMNRRSLFGLDNFSSFRWFHTLAKVTDAPVDTHNLAVGVDFTAKPVRTCRFGRTYGSHEPWQGYGCTVWAAGYLSYSSSDKMAIARWMSAICRGPLISRSMVSAPL
jgi:hypothetical protein